MDSKPEQKQEEEKQADGEQENTRPQIEGVPDILEITIEEGKPTPDIESMCMYCHEQGVTRFMQTTIPFFKQVMISAFECEHCGYKNSEIQFSGKIDDYGVKYEVNVIN